jgi:polyisoprenoid-binding protein YceI
MEKIMNYFKIFAIAIIGFALLVSCSKPEGERVDAEDAKDVNQDASGLEFTVDTGASIVHWEGAKPTGTHNGTVKIQEGKLIVENGNITGGEFVIDLNTIANHDLDDAEMNQKLVGHLKSEDFFHVEKHPVAVFTITEVKNAPEQREGEIATTHSITGNLKMKEQVKSITFPANVIITENAINAETIQFVINRTNWNVNYGSKSIFDDLKDNFIHDDMGLKIKLVATK